MEVPQWPECLGSLLPVPSNDPTNNSESMTLEIGTPLYCSPEQYSSRAKEQSGYSYKTDVYSAGIILFEMLSNFKTDHERIMEIKELKNTCKCRESFKKQHGFPAAIIEQMVALNEKDRLSSSQIFKSPDYLNWAKQLGHAF